ncbi:hypothetical protein L6452_18483 [Arctium lappa]|uniref:Uncharacterized protein n=1 Tax=Arctium lappa TaxID=4217 RepID=A0ACB9C6L3_ARCLA|nr:hypothetical protein L6452_18483 [Arctium lappa]
MSSLADDLIVSSDADIVFSERLLTFKDINGLVEQNVQLRDLVHLLTEHNETEEVEHHASHLQSLDMAPTDRRDDVILLLEGYNDALKRAPEHAYERIKLLEEEMTGL